MLITWELVKIPLAVLGTDTIMWLKWALTDWRIDSWEWKILADRLLLFGTAGFLMVSAGIGWDVAASMAGLGVFADAWIKTLVKPTEPVAEKKISFI
jgi:hypothetical protein